MSLTYGQTGCRLCHDIRSASEKQELKSTKINKTLDLFM